MKRRILWSAVVPAGFAIFSMLFGSGNIMFPIHTGMLTGSNFLLGIAGFLITGILMPLLGLLGIILAKGNKRTYFQELPYPVYFVLISILLALLGPFYVIPRCIHTAYGGIAPLMGVPFWIFSAIFTFSLFVLSYNHEKVVAIIGKIISPFKIGGLLFIAIACLYFAPSIPFKYSNLSWEYLIVGIKQGYQTMDLPAGIFFSTAIYAYLAQFFNGETKSGRRDLLLNAGLACLIGEMIITVVYVCFIMLGASYSSVLAGQDAPLYLPLLAKTALGSSAAIMIAFTLFFSCLAVSLILADLYATYLHEDIFRKKLPRVLSVMITCGISYVISLNGCTKLCGFFLPILTYIYPLLVIFAVYKLFNIYYQTKA